MGKDKVVIALSGGMDSATLLGVLLSENKDVFCCLFRYPSKHNTYEYKSAVSLIEYYQKRGYNVVGKIFDLSQVFNSFESNLLKAGGDIPEGHYEHENMKLTVVPGRNSIFTTVLAGYAESIGASKIYLGVHSGDHAVYPDCRANFIMSIGETVKLSSGGKVEVLAPFLDDYKADILRKGYELGVPYELTRTCYKDQEESCGKCVDKDTLVTMFDFTQKKIKDIVIGDAIVGVSGSPKQFVKSIVTNVIDQGIKETITIKNELGQLLTLTPDHECLAVTSSSNNTEFRRVDKILQSKYSTMYGFGVTIQNTEFIDGWMAGYLTNDARIYDVPNANSSHYSMLRCLCQDKIERRQVRLLLRKAGICTHSYKHHTNEGAFKGFAIYKSDDILNIKSLQLDNINDINSRSLQFLKGWVAGSLDADGYYDSNSIRYYKSVNNKLHLDILEAILTKLHVPYNIQVDSSKQEMLGKVVNFSDINILVMSKQFAGLFPTMLSKRISQFWKHPMFIIQKQLNVTKVSEGTHHVFDISTTTANFLANGMVVHNCGSCTERLEAFELIGKKDPIKYE